LDLDIGTIDTWPEPGTGLNTSFRISHITLTQISLNTVMNISWINIGVLKRVVGNE
jgi:hypothetical protein